MTPGDFVLGLIGLSISFAIASIGLAFSLPIFYIVRDGIKAWRKP